MWVCIGVSVPVLIKSLPPCVQTNTNIPRIKAWLERHLTRPTVNWSLQFSHSHTWASGSAHAHTHISTHKAKKNLCYYFICCPHPSCFPWGISSFLSLFFISPLPVEVEHLLLWHFFPFIFCFLFLHFIHFFYIHHFLSSCHYPVVACQAWFSQGRLLWTGIHHSCTLSIPHSLAQLGNIVYRTQPVLMLR